jgi:amino acid adenylation domain-containing protein
MFFKHVLFPFTESVEKFPDRNAFLINEKFYTYQEFAEQISKIRFALKSFNISTTNIGLVVNDDIETYASIFALWLDGKAYFPLHPLQPFERCEEVIMQVGTSLILDSSSNSSYKNHHIVTTKTLTDIAINLEPDLSVSDENLAYILFTSGSTGKPKGVTITRENIRAFVEAFWNIGYNIDENDRCLQPFDLTFDLSVMSYLIPLLKGACVYTVPYDQIRYSYIAQLLDEHSLTVALMVPSTLRYLKPYFDEIELPNLRYNLFCGEALPLDLIEEWSKCVPNSTIDNVYGPTEDTIFCSHYRFNKQGFNKSHNGILSIGKSMTSGQMIVVNDENLETFERQQGELCLAGKQLSPGYWGNPLKNNEVFFINENGNKFYKTGDICFKDSEGDILYVGRLDSQAKIQGYRVELGEIEFYAKEFLMGTNAVALAFTNKVGNSEICLFIEKDTFDLKKLICYLNTKLPSYMIPTKFQFEPIFPLNINGKIDRMMLKSQLTD